MAEDNRPLLNKIFNPYPNLPGLAGLDITGGKRYLVGKDKGFSSLAKDYTDPNITIGETLLKGLGSATDAGLETLLGLYDFGMRPAQGILNIPAILGSKSPLAKKPEDENTFSDNFQDYMEKNDLSGFNKLFNKPMGVPDQIKDDPAQIIQEQLDALKITDQIKAIPKAITDGDGADTSAGAGAGATDPTIPEGVSPEEEGLPSVEFIDPTKKQSDLDKYTQNLVDETVDKYSKLLAEDSKGNTRDEDIQKYKQEFFEATGIDPSGKPDMRAAMTALGLHLMQNKAGKKFNVGKMLNEVGKAGEAALPLAESAIKEAKAGQLAGGKYALGEIAKDEASRSALLKEQRAALNEINVKNLDFAQKQQLEILKAQLTAKEKDLEYKNEINKELIKASNQGFDLKGFDKMGVQGMEKTLYIQTASDTKSGMQYVMNGKTAARNYAVAHGNVTQTMSLIDTLEGIVNDMSDEDGGFLSSNAVGTIFSKVQNQLKNIGLDIDLGQSFTAEDGTKYDGLTNTSKASALTDRILAESKRFLSKETGNGISEGDYLRLQKLVGDITSATLSGAEKRERLEQLRGIFRGRNAEIENGLKTLGDTSMYINKNVFNDVMSILQDSSVYQSTINFKDPTIGKDGMLEFDATK